MKDRSLWLLVLLTLGLASCAHNPESFYFGNYSEAERLYNKGKYQQAIEKYQAYLADNPVGNLAVISQYYIAKSYVALGKTDEAKPLFEKIVKDYPDVVWANFSKTQLNEIEGAPADTADIGTNTQ
jgi:TolA-binding protein